MAVNFITLTIPFKIAYNNRLNSPSTRKWPNHNLIVQYQCQYPVESTADHEYEVRRVCYTRNKSPIKLELWCGIFMNENFIV